MTVTLITATYNSASTITSCLHTVAEQSYPFIEHLVIDGASTDETMEIVKTWATKYSNIVYRSEPDKGIYDALNKGISLATGDIIGFVHSDDLLANMKVIEDVVNLFKDSGSDGVYGDLKYVDVKNLSKTIRHWKSSSFHSRMLKQGWMPAHPTLFLKTAVYKEMGGFNTSLKIAADYEFILRVFKNPSYKFTYLSKILVLMRVGGASNRSLKNIIKKSTEDYKALSQNRVSFPFFVLLLKNLRKLPQWF